MGQRRSTRVCSGKPRTSPHFFKVLLGDFRERLKIPPNFLKNISSEATKRATLQGPNGSNWDVDLIKTDKGTFFSRGWSKFVDDQSLKEFEFLVFQYDGSMHFNVLVFDTTACLREDLYTHQSCKRAKLNEGKKQLDKLMKHPMNVASLLQPQECKNVAPDLLLDGNHSLKQEQDYGPGRAQENFDKSHSTDLSFIKKEADLPSCREDPKSELVKGYYSRRRPVTEEERSRAQETAKLFKSVFPHLILRMKTRNVYKSFILSFPASFSRSYLPRRRASLVLRDPSGKAWIVNYIPAQKYSLCGGWASFSRGNNLEEGDLCAFELVGPGELHVHIFRVETTPLPRQNHN